MPLKPLVPDEPEVPDKPDEPDVPESPLHIIWIQSSPSLGKDTFDTIPLNDWNLTILPPDWVDPNLNKLNLEGFDFEEIINVPPLEQPER